ncbi:hypothetical protein FJ527_26395 [Mesorhizobium sp. B2-4-18]|uniref:hypothetical protein n=1 Tax=Mesorhizobium sp. B2-4-18 TaxID=2589931 RepID=UPI00112BA963|nr:hypothetical protein [Mesorhizobium sp. B2-4-18]TPK71575.1 hypothetical protein FJ527_26395 [Mesorhizobium sp. B2-4-18]
MDIAAGLSLLSQASGIVKDLREIDKGFDAAALKARMADLYVTLADVKIALSDARETIHDRDRQIKDLEEKIVALTSGELCPICNGGRLKAISVHAHPHLGAAGVQEKTLQCESCTHREMRIHDPEGRLRGKK